MPNFELPKLEEEPKEKFSSQMEAPAESKKSINSEEMPETGEETEEKGKQDQGGFRKETRELNPVQEKILLETDKFEKNVDKLKEKVEAMGGIESLKETIKEYENKIDINSYKEKWAKYEVAIGLLGLVASDFLIENASELGTDRGKWILLIAGIYVGATGIAGVVEGIKNKVRSVREKRRLSHFKEIQGKIEAA